MLETLDLILIAAAAAAAGAVNALAGGGTLITFPVLMAVGVPAVMANVTNTVALCPGYFGATLAQREDLRGQRHRLLAALPAAVAGGVLGAALVLATGERAFRTLVPFLILIACALLALQDRLRLRLQQRRGRSGADLGNADRIGMAGSTGGSTGTAGSGAESGVLAPVLVALAAVYGGYFGAGLSVIVLAVLGIAYTDSLTRLNALKQAVSLTVNVAAAVFFVFSGQVLWSAAAVMAVGALAGGAAGGRLAGRIQPATLRRTVIGAGVAIAVVYLLRS